MESVRYLSWPGGASAVRQWRDGGGDSDSTLSPAQLAADLRLGLCRPGEPSDYHFAIQNCMSLALLGSKRDPDALAWVEWFCWLDIRLVAALPSAARVGGDFVRMLAFDTLSTIYENEGMLEYAKDVVARANGVRNLLKTDVDERLQRLHDEDS